jgi:hypothetical protein
MSSDEIISLAQGSDPFPMDGLQPSIETLTRAQQRFANKNRALPGERSLADRRMVFFYREGAMLTRRWLVDGEGRIIQFDSFARDPVNQGQA